MMTKEEIVQVLPYGSPFLFVDELQRVDENGAEGTYTFREDESFFAGHFKDYPITPGVILTECMAQIGLVCLGIFLVAREGRTQSDFALTETNIQFEKPVYPGEQVIVRSQKVYWRLGKLKCKVEMTKPVGGVICHGEISGMMLGSKKK